MDNIHKDLSKLGLILQLPVAQESISSVVHIKDFVHYYFSRFTSNITHVFDDFSTSEIKEFRMRHSGKMELLVKHPQLKFDSVIVPIPRGMVGTYKDTLQTLLRIFDDIHPRTVTSDLQAMLAAMGTGRFKDLPVDTYSKASFTDAKQTIGKLFGKTGLTHATAQHVLTSQVDIKYTHDALLDVTGRYYPEVISLNPLLKQIEAKHDTVKWSDADKAALSSHLMTMAYRLTIMAVVMDHIQDIEHAFVKSMNTMIKTI